MAGLKGKLGRKKESAVLALLTQRNVEEAARVAGVGVRTLYRWTKEPVFDAAYRSAQRAAFSQSVARLQHMSAAAVSVLGKVISDAGAPPACRVRAADIILERAAEAIEIEDIEARVAELERAANVAKAR